MCRRHFHVASGDIAPFVDLWSHPDLATRRLSSPNFGEGVHRRRHCEKRAYALCTLVGIIPFDQLFSTMELCWFINFAPSMLVLRYPLPSPSLAKKQYLIPVLGDLEEAVQATVDVCGEHDPETWADEIQTLTTKITLLVGGSRRASTVSTRSTAGAGANGATPKVKQTFKDKERKNSSGGEASNTRFPKRPRR